jgi:hypothetical protein
MKPILTSKEKKDVLQPIDPKTGYMNEDYNRVYGEKNNPYVGTERDRRMPKKMIDTRTGLDKQRGYEVERKVRNRAEAERRVEREIKERLRGR